jgi:hypothetical protein
MEGPEGNKIGGADIIMGVAGIIFLLTVLFILAAFLIPAIM